MFKKLSLITFLTCIGFSSTVFAHAPIRVVTTFSILKDLIENVGGKHVDVTAIVGNNADAHVFEPTPQTNITVLAADMLVLNGLEFEVWLERIIEASNYNRTVITATKGVHPQYVLEDEKNPSIKVPDPHAWNSLTHIKTYIHNIKEGLKEHAPEYAADFEENAKTYLEKLESLDQWIHQQFDGIPETCRYIITAHDAFSYFGEEYDIEFLAPQGISTETEPSAKDLADLVKQIRELEIKTLFIENITNSDLVKQLAHETGAEIGGTLYSDSLSESNGPAPDYIAMIKHNVSLLKSAMEKCTKRV